MKMFKKNLKRKNCSFRFENLLLKFKKKKMKLEQISTFSLFLSSNFPIQYTLKIYLKYQIIQEEI